MDDQPISRGKSNGDIERSISKVSSIQEEEIESPDKEDNDNPQEALHERGDDEAPKEKIELGIIR